MILRREPASCRPVRLRIAEGCCILSGFRVPGSGFRVPGTRIANHPATERSTPAIVVGHAALLGAARKRPGRFSNWGLFNDEAALDLGSLLVWFFRDRGSLHPSKT